MNDSDRTSYARTFKSTTLVGGAQAISVVIGLVKMKAVAILLGTLGLGLVEAFQAVVVFVSAVAGLGLQNSGVRDIADARGKENDQQVAETVVALRRMCQLLGILGALATAAASIPLSEFLFKNRDHVWSFVFLSPVIYLTVVRFGQLALIQGHRRVRHLATLNVLATLASTIVAICLYSSLGKDGILPTLFLNAALNVVFAWYYGRKIPLTRVNPSWANSFHRASSLVRLGVVIMWTGILVSCVTFVTRALVLREFGANAVGLFSAAYATSGVVVNFVLIAMTADYFPRLSACADDPQETARLVNEQTEVGVLLAFPGLLATLSLAPWIVVFLYSPDFAEASVLLRWFAAGCMGRVLSFPFGYIVLAQGKSLIYCATETVLNLIHLALAAFLLNVIGLKGVAVGFFLAYVIYTLYMWRVAVYLVDFRWQPHVLTLIGSFGAIAASTALAVQLLPSIPAMLVGLTVSVAAGVFSLRRIVYRLGPEHQIAQILSRLPVAGRLFRSV